MYNQFNQTRRISRMCRKYQIKLIQQDDVCCCSVVNSKKIYNASSGKKEPDGIISEIYKDKKYNRGRILRKLGLWTEPRGINLKQARKRK